MTSNKFNKYNFDNLSSTGPTALKVLRKKVEKQIDSYVTLLQFVKTGLVKSVTSNFLLFDKLNCIQILFNFFYLRCSLFLSGIQEKALYWACIPCVSPVLNAKIKQYKCRIAR